MQRAQVHYYPRYRVVHYDVGSKVFAQNYIKYRLPKLSTFPLHIKNEVFASHSYLVSRVRGKRGLKGCDGPQFNFCQTFAKR